MKLLIEMLFSLLSAIALMSFIVAVFSGGEGNTILATAAVCIVSGLTALWLAGEE